MPNGNGTSGKYYGDAIIKILIGVLGFLAVVLFNMARSNENRITIVETHYVHIVETLDEIKAKLD